MPRPVTVWMVELERGTDLQGVKGTLRMDGECLAFAAAESEVELRVPFGATHKVRRVLGSPVLVLRWADVGGSRETAFYFVQPPPIKGEPSRPGSGREPLDQQRLTLRDGLGRPKRRGRRQSIGYLAARSGETKETVRSWASAISARIGPSPEG